MALNKKRPPARTLEGREKQLASLAIDLAEEQLRNKTAGQQVLVHFLKLASTMTELEKEKIKKEVLLLEQKKESLANSDSRDAMFEKALDAMRRYSGKT